MSMNNEYIIQYISISIQVNKIINYLRDQCLFRVQNNLHKLDITIEDDVEKAIREFQPNFIIHAAAQRFPDKVESDPQAAKILNVEATKYIVQAAGNSYGMSCGINGHMVKHNNNNITYP